MKLRELFQLNIKSFYSSRCDRPNRGGGGLAFFTKDVDYQYIDILSTNSDLEIQGILINWNKRKLQIFNLSHPPNQGCLPESFFLEQEPNNIPCISLGNSDAKYLLWGCPDYKNRGDELLKAVDDRSLLFIKDGSHTPFLFRYKTAESLDVSFVSADLYPE